jgi:hypothetical protein
LNHIAIAVILERILTASPCKVFSIVFSDSKLIIEFQSSISKCEFWGLENWGKQNDDFIVGKGK